MDELPERERAVELLQQLGLKEYEAQIFVALSRAPQGTAKEISEWSGVPRTRVYDAVEVLESKGLVETQHSTPQRFRAVSVDEATETLRRGYECRTESLRETLENVEPPDTDPEVEVAHEVWSLSGTRTVTERTEQLVADAEDEVVLVVGHGAVFTDELADALAEAADRGVDVVVGTVDDQLRERVDRDLPEASVFVSGLEWLATTVEDDAELRRLLLADGTSILVSTSSGSTDAGGGPETAVFGQGVDNGFVTVIRRLMATGLRSSAE